MTELQARMCVRALSLLDGMSKTEAVGLFGDQYGVEAAWRALDTIHQALGWEDTP
jgi:hypothetical protein